MKSLSYLYFVYTIRAMCLDLFLRECPCRKKREIEIQKETDISLEATLKEREHI